MKEYAAGRRGMSDLAKFESRFRGNCKIPEYRQHLLQRFDEAASKRRKARDRTEWSRWDLEMDRLKKRMQRGGMIAKGQ